MSIFNVQAQNYNGETPARVLINAIKRMQKKRSRRVANDTTQSNEPMCPVLQLQHPDQDHDGSPSRAGKLPLVAPTTSAETTGEFSDGDAAVPPALQPAVPAPPYSALSSTDPSPALDSEAEEQDIEVLIQCLEILNEATQVSPSQESLSSFGYHSASERRSSFDLDSDVTDAGQEDRQGEVVEEEVQDRAAYSWSPPYTPSLDQPDHYCTPKTPRTPMSANSSY